MSKGRDSYHNRPEWSYSQMKMILDSGIDYAVGSRLGMTPPIGSHFIDLGELAHMLILGGEDTFALSEFDDFRTKKAREWRDAQIAAGKAIITQDDFKSITQMVEHVEKHPLSQKYLLGDGFKHEVEMYAQTASGTKLRGKADALKVSKDSLIITDIKTTGKFDDFKKSASWRHYDLQAAVYTLIGGASQKINSSFVNYYFCVVETIMPYRVKFFHASPEFLDAGERKLSYCVSEVEAFGDKKPNFLYEEVEELGDFGW